MKRAVLVILDGLRRDFVDAERTPHLAEFTARAEQFPAYRTAFPSATRVVTATLATGCHPARHTLQGNAMALLEDGVLVPHDAGLPDFLQHKRAVTGHSLGAPTLAERLVPHGGAIIYTPTLPVSEKPPCQAAESGFYRRHDTARLPGRRIAARPA